MYYRQQQLEKQKNRWGGGGYHGGCLLAPQADGLVQQLGHLLVVGMVFPTRPAGNEAIVLQLGHVLAGEALHHTPNRVVLLAT